MKLVVGLGNPGKDYENTRHNMGFFMLSRYLESKNLLSFKRKFNGIYVDTFIGDEEVIFLMPQSFINLSGEVIKKYMDFYKISIDDLLVISDDLDLNVGNYKLKAKGSSGGHNGLKNIEYHLKTSKYRRIKIGICNGHVSNTIDYVLGKIPKEELLVYQNLSVDICKILDEYFEVSFDFLVSKYNRKNR